MNVVPVAGARPEFAKGEDRFGFLRKNRFDGIPEDAVFGAIAELSVQDVFDGAGRDGVAGGNVRRERRPDRLVNRDEPDAEPAVAVALPDRTGIRP